ncbi:MAG: UDP-N-acetylmuramoyl-L-alanine--D-glutamate ligase [Candidatus Dadabacteria bacterium]|nr:MAG: UDP-N-acetylmuramoyl-L-alanine--D-glutamate ligase [Candidatus Dadabacteria bacterium]
MDRLARNQSRGPFLDHFHRPGDCRTRNTEAEVTVGRYEGQHWGVIGAGRTGVAAARYLAAEGAGVVLADDDPGALGKAAEVLADLVEVRPADAVLATDAARWVISPGIPPTHPLVAAVRDSGRGCSDLDLWSAARPALTVAVTGTNGKSTVCAMLAEIFRESGFETALGANYGTPVGELLMSETRVERAILEVSSFQLMYAEAFSPEVAIVTNLAPDHLDWHSDLTEYRTAKERIAREMTPEQLLIVPRELADFAPDSAAMRAIVGEGLDPATVERGASIRDDELLLFFGKRQANLSLADVREKIPFIENAAMAALAAWSTGASVEQISAALQRFEPLAHRFEVVAERRGVTWVNDSKATNLHALVAAVQTAGGPVRLLAGGKDKGLNWGSVIDAIIPSTIRVYAFGESADAIRDAWQERLDVHVSDKLIDAVRVVAREANAGDVVLLAPGTSSFDEFASYAERGLAFREAVASLDQEAGS